MNHVSIECEWVILFFEFLIYMLCMFLFWFTNNFQFGCNSLFSSIGLILGYKHYNTINT